MIYDIIIIGSGPAGLNAGLYSSRQNLKTLILASEMGGQMGKSYMIENYLGYEAVFGIELLQKFFDQVHNRGVEIKLGETASKIERKQKNFVISTNSGSHEGKIIIIASGRTPRKLNVPGEEKFIHKGVTYCATCDAPLFSGKAVAVIGGGNGALHATMQLLNIAKKIFIITINKELQGEQVLIEKLRKEKNVEILYEAKTTEFLGKDFLEGIKVKIKNSEKRIAVQGAFIEIGSEPNSDIEVQGTELKKNEFKEIIVDSEGRTNIEGIFAAGDVTSVRRKQIIIAAAEGCKAALSAFDFLSKR
ncbi:MAG: FAD-dependent oxidoreductase [Candidatus Diapherotrites archaeon]